MDDMEVFVEYSTVMEKEDDLTAQGQSDPICLPHFFN